MIEKTRQKIEEEIIKLPKNWQEAIHSLDWSKESEEIGKKYLLTESEINDLQIEIGLVITGLEEQELFGLNIENNVVLSKDEAEKITEEINQKIFEPILKKLELEPATTIPVEQKPENNKLDPRFASLPMETQTAISKSDYQKNIYVVGEKYKLNVEQMGILEDITIQVMLNIIHPDKYEEILSSKITIGKDDITNLVKDINELVFKKIRSLEMEGGISSKEQVVSSKREEEIPLPPYVISSKEQVVSSGEDTSKGKEEIPNIMEDKLKGITASNQTTTDYSTPKIDPYREQF